MIRRLRCHIVTDPLDHWTLGLRVDDTRNSHAAAVQAEQVLLTIEKGNDERHHHPGQIIIRRPPVSCAHLGDESRHLPATSRGLTTATMLIALHSAGPQARAGFR